MTGATGLIGREIVKLRLQKTIVIHYLTTSKAKLNSDKNYKGFYWNPSTNEIDHNCFKDIDIIINLVGASIAKRWTKSYKKEIIESRIKTAHLLQDTIKNHNYSIKHVISASAVGIYPSSSYNYYDETNIDISNSFLGQVVEQWETAINGFKDLGCKVTKVRIGLVLSNKGGVLPKLTKPIKYFAGAIFGNGKQWQSWIHIRDLAAIFVFLLEQNLTGIFNAVAPNPVTHKKCMQLTAKTLKKPLIIPNIPKSIIKLILGEMHILLFESQRISSKKIETVGYNFRYTNLETALKDLL